MNDAGRRWVASAFAGPALAFAVLALGARPARAVDEAALPSVPAIADPLQEQTREVADSAARIADRVPEVEGLRSQAERMSDAGRIACIDEKLGRIRRSKEASDVIRRSWPTARSHVDFARRSVERMRLLKLYAISAAEEAHRCNDTKTRSETIVKIERAIPEVGRPGDPVRPPVFERPPLASPY